MKRRLISVVVMAFTLLACSSQVDTTHYYLLTNKVTPASDFKALALKHKGAYLVSIVLPEYLARPHLVMQLEEHQINYAPFHLWAEPLEKGVKKSLLFDLNNAGKSEFKNHSTYNPNTLLPSIAIDIDFFHITHQSSVILSGSYTLNNGKKIQSKRFLLEEQLNKNGYSHSVKKMRLLINKLSNEMHHYLQK